MNKFATKTIFGHFGVDISELFILELIPLFTGGRANENLW